MRNNDFLGDEDYEELQQNDLENIHKEMEFERIFYETISDTDNFEVIGVPDENGNIMTSEEKRYLESVASYQGTKLLFRISHGKFATVFDPETGKVGVMPETDLRGFAC